MKIVITQKLMLPKESLERLKSLGEVKLYDTLSKTPEEWFKRCKDADIICTGKFGLKSDKLYDLENEFISVPFVGTGFLDLERLKERNITVARSPECNRLAVSEWIIGMIINLLRGFSKYINVIDLPKGEIPPRALGLAGKKVIILGKGNVGSQVGNICESLNMEVGFFDKENNLGDSVQNADIVVNVLSSNPTTDNLLNKDFFQSLKKGAFFITVTSPKIYDVDAMFEALDDDILAGVADDSANAQVGDTHDSLYRRLVDHPKVLTTPHIAYNTESTNSTCSSMMVDNVEAWIKGKPINIIQ